MRDAGCGMQDAQHDLAGNTRRRAASSFGLFGGAMTRFDGSDETIQLGTEFVQAGVDLIKEHFIGQRSGLEEFFEMVDGFVAGAVSVGEVLDELQLVASATVTLDDVTADRLRRASNLGCGFKLLKLRELGESHSMNVDCNLTSQLPDVQISITHAGHDTGCEMRDARCDFLTRSARKRPRARQCDSSKTVLRIPHPASRIPHPTP